MFTKVKGYNVIGISSQLERGYTVSFFNLYQSFAQNIFSHKSSKRVQYIIKSQTLTLVSTFYDDLIERQNLRYTKMLKLIIYNVYRNSLQS